MRALAGFGYVMLDGEHGRFSPKDAYALTLAAEARGIKAMACVGQNDRQVILLSGYALRYLEIGRAATFDTLIPVVGIGAADRVLREARAGSRHLGAGARDRVGFPPIVQRDAPRRVGVLGEGHE